MQDDSVPRGGAGPVTATGRDATVGHMCVVHGAAVGAEALIGNGSTVQDGAGGRGNPSAYRDPARRRAPGLREIHPVGSAGALTAG